MAAFLQYYRRSDFEKFQSAILKLDIVSGTFDQIRSGQLCPRKRLNSKLVCFIQIICVIRSFLLFNPFLPGPVRWLLGDYFMFLGMTGKVVYFGYFCVSSIALTYRLMLLYYEKHQIDFITDFTALIPSHGRRMIPPNLHLTKASEKSLLKSIRVIFWLVKLASFGGSILLCFFQISCFSYTLFDSYSFHSPFSYGDLLIRSFWLLMSCRYSYIMVNDGIHITGLWLNSMNYIQKRLEQFATKLIEFKNGRKHLHHFKRFSGFVKIAREYSHVVSLIERYNVTIKWLIFSTDFFVAQITSCTLFLYFYDDGDVHQFLRWIVMSAATEAALVLLFVMIRASMICKITRSCHGILNSLVFTDAFPIQLQRKVINILQG